MHVSIFGTSPNFQKGWLTWLLLEVPLTANQPLLLQGGWRGCSARPVAGSGSARSPRERDTSVWESRLDPPQVLSAEGPHSPKHQEQPRTGVFVQDCTKKLHTDLQPGLPPTSTAGTGGPEPTAASRQPHGRQRAQRPGFAEAQCVKGGGRRAPRARARRAQPR